MKKQVFIIMVVGALFVLGVWKLPDIVTDIGYNKGYAEGYSSGFTQGYAKCEDDLEYLFAKRMEASETGPDRTVPDEETAGQEHAPELSPGEAGKDQPVPDDGDKSNGFPGEKPADDGETELFDDEVAQELIEEGSELLGDVLRELPGRKYEYTEKILREELLPRLFSIAEEYGDSGYEKGREALDGLLE